MKYVIGPILLLAALAAGNPIITTIINEFGFDDDSLGWVELHSSFPEYPEMDMTGWLLTTNSSVCTLAYAMPPYGFLVVDSASLAGGGYGHGTFRLDPAGDTIRMMPDPDHLEYAESIVFPLLPCGEGRAPMPPEHGSASLSGMYGRWTPVLNWYVDSTPTRGQQNDDYSCVAGVVRWGSGHYFDWVDIVVSGPMGVSYSNVDGSGVPFVAPGLGAGRYQIAACGWQTWPGESLFYPESVDLGYSETLPGIILDFNPSGVEESRQPTAYSSQPTATILTAPGVARLASSVIFDAMGRRVRDPKPGVYFVRDEGRGAGDAGPMRKVLVTR